MFVYLNPDTVRLVNSEGILHVVVMSMRCSLFAICTICIVITRYTAVQLSKLSLYYVCKTCIVLSWQWWVGGSLMHIYSILNECWHYVALCDYMDILMYYNLYSKTYTNIEHGHGAKMSKANCNLAVHVPKSSIVFTPIYWL